VAEVREASHEPLNAFDVPDLAYFGDGRDLIGVCFDAALGDDVTQELSPGDPEGAFFWVQLHVEPPKVVEGFFQVSDVVAAPSRFDDDVVNIDF
jgi:hypothetical protein